MALPLAVYGSLRTGLALPRQPPDLEGFLGVDRTPCLLSGRLVDLGEYPGLVDADGDSDGPVVVADLCRLAGDAALAALDAYEGFRPDRPDRSRYVRRRVTLRRPEVEAWTYVYHQGWDGSIVVPGGDWARHLAARPAGQRAG